VLDADALGEPSLELVRLRPGGQPARLQHLDGGRDLAVTDGGPMKRYGLGLRGQELSLAGGFDWRLG
jgi:hypothetical protein